MVINDLPPSILLKIGSFCHENKRDFGNIKGFAVFVRALAVLVGQYTILNLERDKKAKRTLAGP
ncbi:hypothetical protein Sez_1317 [Streptococcus equi subsp. zooepidemicus MGCS10565]|uniref:Transposase n=1 Tax=Streptococcus equi subsp. zooepidemicus (strain MGCS10565) TaxID=552526 RepID=B4U3T6_STREM|nr:hypothetical protein Sez_1317 [Streptococcus equi subsp. zooepidemicus MGCS10565]